MNRRKIIPTIVFIAVVFLVAACTSGARRDVSPIELQATALNKAIMCPVCPGESIDQSQNPLAVSMRQIVAEKLAERWSGQQIKEFFVERYGPSVLLAPPTEGFSLAVWLLPPVAVAVAALSVWMGLRRMRRTTPVQSVGTVLTLTQEEEDVYFQRLQVSLDLDEVPDDTPRQS